MKEEFGRVFGGEPEVVAFAPGRIEVLGNHTDYNGGEVLSMAVDRGTWVGLRKIEDDGGLGIRDQRSRSRSSVLARVVSVGMGDGVREVRLGGFSAEQGDWVTYVKGVLVELEKRGVVLEGFEALVVSDLPRGAGMSSSASLEMALVVGLDELWGLGLERMEMARIGQGCENDFLGARTGLMDQVTVLCGRKGHLVWSEYVGMGVRAVPFSSEWVFVVVDSGVKHDLSKEYGARRRQCERVADVMGGGEVVRGGVGGAGEGV